ncbi:hypothetical protein BHE74_00010886 [Ensete ventricosum]|nr:hypothetical protein GW17_00032908 [Ensete ventricosum]RWW80755.1 hypothetical protein BHE74_00010886 [Ensete ventricosum]RZR94177.1 hypothetical protein BHM03_00022819 [Ensete ventricosum]
MDYDFRCRPAAMHRSDAAVPYPRVGSVAPQPDRRVSNLHPSSPAPPLSSSGNCSFSAALKTLVARLD